MAEYIERCVDCLHFKACQDWATDMFGADTQFPYEARRNLCEHFKPTADVVEVRHGEWEKDPIQTRDDGEIYDYRCSVCTARAHKGEYGNYDYFTSYCPNCGAKMDGKGEE